MCNFSKISAAELRLNLVIAAERKTSSLAKSDFSCLINNSKLIVDNIKLHNVSEGFRIENNGKAYLDNIFITLQQILLLWMVKL